MPSLRSQSGWGTRLLVDFELLEVCNEAAFVQYSAILQAVCLKLEIYIADINDVVYVLVTTDLHMIPVGENPESHIVCNRCFLVEWLIRISAAVAAVPAGKPRFGFNNRKRNNILFLSLALRLHDHKYMSLLWRMTP
ncbi:hypothetical protein DPMN_139547 [Dreissena polymorpha]|uniref:Uncharacterized protein n=1 Tax=Dreissena polymorpha TaxID=45954 RepID=A0A9D4G647_DREPO|nr:hypothetical protein DPMN_139547 [Dreissena polymorpha]